MEFLVTFLAIRDMETSLQSFPYTTANTQLYVIISELGQPVRQWSFR